MIRTPSHLIQERILFKKILDKMQVNTRIVPANIWYDPGVVKVSDKNIKHLNVTCIIEAGKNIKALNFWLLGLVASWSISLSKGWYFTEFHRKKMNKQKNSPTESPQVWRNGCLNTVTVPFLPSDSNVLVYLKLINVFDKIKNIALRISN